MLDTTANNNNAYTALDNIALLKDNWNKNGAQAFHPDLIEKCRDIIAVLPIKPLVFPTAQGSIQLEYEKLGSKYLEIEIFPDRIECYIKGTLSREREFILDDTAAIHRVVSEFLATNT